MRDPNRIDYYCDELANIWHKVPDWRFGQLMVNIITAYANKHNDIDPFYVEDADFMKFVREFIKETTDDNA